MLVGNQVGAFSFFIHRAVSISTFLGPKDWPAEAESLALNIWQIFPHIFGYGSWEVIEHSIGMCGRLQWRSLIDFEGNRFIQGTIKSEPDVLEFSRG